MALTDKDKLEIKSMIFDAMENVFSDLRNESRFGDIFNSNSEGQQLLAALIKASDSRLGMAKNEEQKAEKTSAERNAFLGSSTQD
jgi:hypothetical protein